MSRLPGTYGRSADLAISPSSPAPSKVWNHSRAVARSVVVGVRWTGATALASTSASRARRGRDGGSSHSPPARGGGAEAQNQGGGCPGGKVLPGGGRGDRVPTALDA